MPDGVLCAATEGGATAYLPTFNVTLVLRRHPRYASAGRRSSYASAPHFTGQIDSLKRPIRLRVTFGVTLPCLLALPALRRCKQQRRLVGRGQPAKLAGSRKRAALRPRLSSTAGQAATRALLPARASAPQPRHYKPYRGPLLPRMHRSRTPYAPRANSGPPGSSTTDHVQHYGTAFDDEGLGHRGEA